MSHFIRASSFIKFKVEKRPPIIFHPIDLDMFSFSKTVLRKEDFMALRFDFYNLQKIDGDSKLDSKIKEKESYIVVHFPPQQIVEEAYYQKISHLDQEGEEEIVRSSPIPALIAGPSRLAFAIPKSLLPLSYNLNSLLEWWK